MFEFCGGFFIGGTLGFLTCAFFVGANQNRWRR